MDFFIVSMIMEIIMETATECYSQLSTWTSSGFRIWSNVPLSAVQREAALVKSVDSKECGLPVVAETLTLKRNVAVEFLKNPLQPCGDMWENALLSIKVCIWQDEMKICIKIFHALLSLTHVAIMYLTSFHWIFLLLWGVYILQHCCFGWCQNRDVTHCHDIQLDGITSKRRSLPTYGLPIRMSGQWK